jgi:hypothetical protein
MELEPLHAVDLLLFLSFGATLPDAAPDPYGHTHTLWLTGKPGLPRWTHTELTDNASPAARLERRTLVTTSLEPGYFTRTKRLR